MSVIQEMESGLSEVEPDLTYSYDEGDLPIRRFSGRDLRTNLRRRQLRNGKVWAFRPCIGRSAAPSISYVSGHMILGAEIDGTFVYHLGDALSSVRDVVDSSGNVIRSNEWDEYGNLISSSGSGQASPKTWVGGLSVNDDTADSKLYNMGHRNYAGGVLGRFISRDPIGHAGNFNLYAYPTNPLRHVDATGLEPNGPHLFDPTDPLGVEMQLPSNHSFGKIVTLNSAGLGTTFFTYNGLDTSGLCENALKAGYSRSDLSYIGGPASIDEFKQAFASKPDLLIFNGHHYNRPGGHGYEIAGALLQDGSVRVEGASGGSASAFPKVTVFAACNTHNVSPLLSKTGGQAFVGFKGFVNGNAAAVFATGLHNSLVSGASVSEAVQSGIGAVENSKLGFISKHGSTIRSNVIIKGNPNVRIR